MSASMRDSESGNILIYILGAIILIGLLVILVKGNTTPGSGIDRETLELRIAEVQQYGMELERAVAYILQSGYSETDIRFAHPNHSSLYGDITDDPGRQVFALAGGGATWRDNDISIQTMDMDWLFTSDNKIPQVGSGFDAALGTPESSELIALLSFVTRDFCLALNDKVGMDNPSGEPPNDGSNMRFGPGEEFAGNYGNHLIISDGSAIPGKTEGCVYGGSGGTDTYHYYRVLLAR